MREIIFFAGKLLYRPFRGIFWGGQDFFDPLNLGVKKVEAPSKYPEFAQKQKNNISNFKISGTLVILCPTAHNFKSPPSSH